MGNSRVIDAVRVRDQLGRPDDKALFGPFRLNERVRMTEGPSIALKRDVSTSTRWDISKWDENEWNEVASQGFILGSPSAGVLGTSKLGSTGTSFEVVSITNPNQNFVWQPYFDNTDGTGDYPLTRSLIGDNTTATIDYNTGEATFTAGQVLEIVSAFKDGSNKQKVISAILNIEFEE